MTSDLATEFDDVHRRLLNVEEDLGLFELEEDGAAVWERLRKDVFNLASNTLDALLDGGAGTGGVSPARRVSRWTWQIGANAVRRNPLLASEHDLLFWGHERRKLRDDGRWWDLYCDPLHEGLKYDYVHLESPIRDTHMTPAKTDSLRYLDLDYYGKRLVPALGLVDYELSPGTTARLRRASGRLEAEFGLDVDLVALARRHFTRRQVSKPLYRRILRRVDPSVVVLVVSYGKETFIEACRERGVPVVELQHGIIHPYNYGYHYPGTRTKETFPDYLFTFGEFWSDQAALPIDDDRVIPVGYPYLERGLEDHPPAETGKQIVFISQEDSGKGLSQMAVAVAESARLDYDVVYKLHPSEYDIWQEVYPWVADTDVTVVDDPDEQSLYSIFATSTAQVGVGSTAIFEGLAFGLDTYLVNYPSVEKLAGLIETGDVGLVESSEDLIGKLDSDSDNSTASAEYFASDALSNAERALENIRS